MSEGQKAEIESMVEGIADEKVKSHVAKAVKYVGDAGRRLIVVNGIVRAREGGHGELALKLARLACEQSPDDPFFLVELCYTLGDAQEVVDEINRYGERVSLDSLPQDQRERIVIALAEGYKGLGKTEESIQALEELQSELARAVELLAEQYYESGEPQKTIDLLDTRIKYVGRLTPAMAGWLTKSFDTTGDYSRAFDMLAQFDDNPEIKSLFDKARKEMGYVVEEEGPGRLPFDHPQPEDQRDNAEKDLSSLL